MFAQAYRFHSKRNLPKLSFSAPIFRIRYQHNRLGHYRCAVAVGKRVDKRAVVRNKIRRQIIHILKEIFNDYSISYDMIVYIQKEILGKEREEIKQDFVKTLHHLTILPE